MDGWMDGGRKPFRRHASIHEKRTKPAAGTASRRQDGGRGRACRSALEETSAYAWRISTRPSPPWQSPFIFIGCGQRGRDKQPKTQSHTCANKSTHPSHGGGWEGGRRVGGREGERAAGGMTFFFLSPQSGRADSDELWPDARPHPLFIRNNKLINEVNEEEQRRPG